jgi:hypothetical protein
MRHEAAGGRPGGLVPRSTSAAKTQEHPLVAPQFKHL